MEAKDLVVRDYRQDDEKAIVALFNTVFGAKRSLQHWQWKFEKNPYSDPIASLVEDVDKQKLAGQYTVLPLKFNFRGTATTACQSVDTMVDAGYQGQGLFVRTANHCYDRCRSKGLSFLVGFPNAASYPGFVRRLGWQRVAFFREFKLRLGVPLKLKSLNRLLGLYTVARVARTFWLKTFHSLNHKILQARAGRQLETEISDVVPQDYDRLWSLIKNYEVLSVWKDQEYLSWRYENNPDRQFTFFSLRDDGVLVGFAVAFSEANELRICEWMVRHRDLDQSRLLLSLVTRFALQNGRHAVVFVGLDQGFFAQVFSGFQNTLRSELVLIVKQLEDNPDLDKCLSYDGSWTLTWGDFDSF